MKTSPMPTVDDDEDGDCEMPEGTSSADWKADAQEVLEAVDEQLKAFGLQIEQFESDGDYYLWRIIKR